MPTVPDVDLISSWEDVDEAAQAIKNGIQKEHMASSVKTSLEKADGAVQNGLQRTATDWDTEEAAIDENGKIVVKPSVSDEAKYSLLSLLSDVAYATPNAEAKLADLTQKLFPTAYLVSISADYEQDRPIYATDSIDLVRLDLAVTANYSDGTSAVLADDAYTLSGTLTVGNSVITVSYGGKTATITVICTAKYWLYRFEQSLASDGSEDIGWDGSPTYSTGHDGEGYSYYNGDGIIQSTQFTAPDLSGDFTVSWWQKTATEKKGQGLSAFKVGTASGVVSPTGFGSPENVKSGYSVVREQNVGKSVEGFRIFWSNEKFYIRCITSDLAYGGVYDVTMPSSFSSLVWHHFALTRKSNILRLFIDGEMIFSAQVTIVPFFNSQVALGGYYANAGDTSARAGTYLCYYDDFFIAEYCKWDSDFDPSAIQY